MDAKDLLQRADETPNVATRSAVGRPPNLSQAVGEAVEDPLLRLRLELNRAWEQYRSRSDDEAHRTVQRLLAELEPMTDLRGTPRADAPAGSELLLPMALALRGRIRRRVGRDEDAEADFRRAVDLFDRCLSSTSDAGDQALRHYGVALHWLGASRTPPSPCRRPSAGATRARRSPSTWAGTTRARAGPSRRSTPT